MRKIATWFAAMKAHLKDGLGTDIDGILVTQRTVLDAIDSGMLSQFLQESRALTVVLLRRADEVVNDPRAGDNHRLTSSAQMEIVILVSTQHGNPEERFDDEQDAYRLYDLCEQVQDLVETMPLDAETSIHSNQIRSTNDFTDAPSMFFGATITVEGFFKRV